MRHIVAVSVPHITTRTSEKATVIAIRSQCGPYIENALQREMHRKPMVPRMPPSTRPARSSRASPATSRRARPRPEPGRGDERRGLGAGVASAGDDEGTNVSTAACWISSSKVPSHDGQGLAQEQAVASRRALENACERVTCRAPRGPPSAELCMSRGLRLGDVEDVVVVTMPMSSLRVSTTGRAVRSYCRNTRRPLAVVVALRATNLRSMRPATMCSRARARTRGCGCRR